MKVLLDFSSKPYMHSLRNRSVSLVNTYLDHLILGRSYRLIFYPLFFVAYNTPPEGILHSKLIRSEAWVCGLIKYVSCKLPRNIKNN